MAILIIHDILGKRVLVTRESAQLLKPHLDKVVSRNVDEFSLDFRGIAGATPSFIDEALAIVGDVLLTESNSGRHLRIVNLQNHMWPKFFRAGKRHSLLVREEGGTDLIISKMEGDI